MLVKTIEEPLYLCGPLQKD